MQTHPQDVNYRSALFLACPSYWLNARTSWELLQAPRSEDTLAAALILAIDLIS